MFSRMRANREAACALQRPMTWFMTHREARSKHAVSRRHEQCAL
jgi:hypothetical protein